MMPTLEIPLDVAEKIHADNQPANKIPKICHQFWTGELPHQVYLWMETVRKFHPDWHFMLWNERNISGLGLDIEQMIVECNHPASYSSVIRLLAVQKYGGVYLDCDIEMLKPLDPLLKYDAFCAIQDNISSGDAPNRICSAVFGATPNHPWINWQVQSIPQFQSHDPVFGIHLMSQAPRDGVTIVPTHYFYPWSFNTPVEQRKVHPDSYLIHWWSGSWLE